MVYTSHIFMVCLLSITFVNGFQKDCSREDGDELIFSQPFMDIDIFGEQKVQKTFEDYKITCIEANLPFGLKIPSIFNIVGGGVGCDSINLKIAKMFFFPIGIKIYGTKLESGETTDSTCKKLKNSLKNNGFPNIFQGII